MNQHWIDSNRKVINDHKVPTWHNTYLIQRVYFRFNTKEKFINISVEKCSHTVVKKSIWLKKHNLMLVPYKGVQRATLDYILWHLRQNHLSLTTASPIIWNGEEWGLPPAHGEHSMTWHALGWQRHDLFPELMVHTTEMFKCFLNRIHNHQ